MSTTFRLRTLASCSLGDAGWNLVVEIPVTTVSEDREAPIWAVTSCLYVSRAVFQMPIDYLANRQIESCTIVFILTGDETRQPEPCLKVTVPGEIGYQVDWNAKELESYRTLLFGPKSDVVVEYPMRGTGYISQQGLLALPE